MKNAYTESITLANGKISYNNSKYSHAIKSDTYKQLSAQKNLISATVTTYFLAKDKYDISVPVMKSRVASMLNHSYALSSFPASQEYPELYVTACVYDNGSTSSTRKYQMTGCVEFKQVMNNSIDQNDLVGISWAGNEAIKSDYGSAWYYPGSYGDKSQDMYINGARDRARNNAGVSYRFNGKYRYWLVDRDPELMGTTANVEQDGQSWGQYNMTTTYVYTYAKYDYSFEFSLDGGSMSVTPNTGSELFTCTTTY